jgi:hypothetical protein
MTMAVFITGGSVVISLAIGIIASYPKVAVVPMAIIGAGLAVVVPTITYPFTYTIFSSFDLAVHPPSAEEFVPEVAATSTPDTYASPGQSAGSAAPSGLRPSVPDTYES